MLLIENAKIYTMDGDCRVIDNGYVFIKEGKIAEVGSCGDEAEEPVRSQGALRVDLKVRGSDRHTAIKAAHPGLRVLDATGKLVLPGFIDAHCHVGIWEDGVGVEGDDGNESTDPITPHLRAIDGIYHADRSFTEALEAGVTTVVTGPGSANVIAGQFAAVKTFGQSVDDMLLKAPIAMKVAFGENPKTVYSEKRQTPMTRMATAALLRESLTKAKEYLEQKEEYEKDKEENDKPEFDMKLESLIMVLKGEIPLKVHAHRTDDILTAIRIAKEFGVAITLDHCTEGHLITDIILREGLSAIVGPSLVDRSKIELRNLTPKTAGVLSNAGVKVAIMTDHPCTPIQYLPLCAAMAVREGMSENDALRAITINAAEITGISERVGSIEVAKDADIVVFDGHPFLYSSSTFMTLIDGKVVYER